MFGGQGESAGDPPPYSSHQPAVTQQQALPVASDGGVFGTAGTFDQPSSLFGHTTSATGHWSTAASAPTSVGMMSGKPVDSSAATPGQQLAHSHSLPATATVAFDNAAVASTQASSMVPLGHSATSMPVFGQTSSVATPSFGQMSAVAASSSFGLAVSPGSVGFQSAATPIFGATTSAVPSPLFSQPVTTSARTKPQLFGATQQDVSTTQSSFSDKAGSTIRSLFGAGAADTAGSTAPAGSSLFSKPSVKSSGLFGKPKSAAGDSAKSGTADPPAALFGKTSSDNIGLFGKPKLATNVTKDSTAPEPRPTLFGKASEDKVGLFGKPKPVANVPGPKDLTAPEPPPTLFGKTTRDNVGLFGKPKLAGSDPGESAAAPPPASSLAGSDRPGGGSLFGKTVEGEAPPAAGLTPGAGRPRSVFTRPGADSPATRKRRTSTTTAEASRRTLSRTGLFGKPAETRAADKSPVTFGPSGPRVQRLSSAEELQQVTALLCTEVPEGYNDRNILSRHFAKFGRVVRVNCNPSKNKASVHFADHAAADAAKKRGMRVHPKVPPMGLYFLRSAKGGPERARPPPPYFLRSMEGGPKMTPDDDVSDELRAMAGETREETPKPRRAEPPSEPKPRRAATASAAAAAAPSVPSAAAAGAGSGGGAASVNVSELRAALRQPAAAAGDRFRVLDARDKLQRAAMRREAPARSGPLVGTCPDMCPEKERYMREEKHQISSHYERDRDRQGGFEMDHRLAVKQYSRSSADQEEPLPHELRTPAALLLTMDYLVTHVTDADTRDTGDWFHFIWDRTRGIRKDITQQQLTDGISVGLVEKCARFHVHCASALCELSRDMFDQKINNENLTKCLQTLKHMYHDLSLKGVRCEREAEFRAYDILLNLNQGDILREAQTYSDEVRDSPEVQAALRLYLALSTNNYVRFFKLVRRADYLASCLLQRYFNQVRTRALDVITRTFCPPKKVVEYPLSELQLMLGFESEQECASVLRQHGLESEEGTAFLERVLFQPPDTAPELRRCPTLIDSKLVTSIGQTINGGALPADPLPGYRPHDSFDGQGVLRRSAWHAQDQDGAEPAGDWPPAAGSRPGSPAPVVPERLAETVAGGVLAEVVTEETRRLADHLLTVTSVARQLCAQFYQTTVDEVVAEMVRGTCQSVLVAEQEQRRLQEQQRREEEVQRRLQEEKRARQLQEQARAKRDEEMKDRLCGMLTKTLIAEVCLDETADIAEQEMVAVQAKHSVTEELHLQLWTEGADGLARQTAEGVLAECRRRRETLLQALAQIGRRMTLRRLVGRWRRAAEDGRRLRAEQEQFPAGRPLHDAQTTLRLMGGPREPPHPPADRWADWSLCSLLLNDRLSSRPVSVVSALARCPAAGAVSGPVLWKLAVPAPAACPLTQWLLHKLSYAEGDGDPEQLPGGVLQRGSASLPAGGRLSVCVRQLCGRPAEAVGAGGLLLAVSGQQAAGRLLQLLAQLPREPLLPLAVLAPPGSRQQTLAQLRLPDLLRDGAVSTYRVFDLEPEDALQSGEMLTSALEWLFEHRPAAPPLRAARLRHLAEDFVGREVTRRLYADLHARRNRRRVEQSPSTCMALYNAAVRHLSAVVSSASLPDLSWPPAELAEELLADSGLLTALPPADWNQPARLLRLQQAARQLSLPELDVGSDWSWTESCAKVLQYVGRLAEEDAGGAPALYRVRGLLRDRLQLLRRAAWPLDDEVGDQPLSTSLPWTDIVQCCIELRISQLSCTEEVFYLPDELANFRVPDVWTEYTSVAHTDECLTLGESVTIAKRALDTSMEESPSVKRRPDKSSLVHPSLDVSTGIGRELNVSLDWEDRLRELVDQGVASGGPHTVTAAVTCPSLPLPPPAGGRRASLGDQLERLQAQLAADRRHADQLSRLLEAAGAEPGGVDGPSSGRTSAAAVDGSL